MTLASIVNLKCMFTHFKDCVLIHQIFCPLITVFFAEFICFYGRIRLDAFSPVVFETGSSITMKVCRDTQHHILTVFDLNAIQQRLKLGAIPGCIKKDSTIGCDHIHAVRRNGFVFIHSIGSIYVEVAC